MPNTCARRFFFSFFVFLFSSLCVCMLLLFSSSFLWKPVFFLSLSHQTWFQLDWCDICMLISTSSFPQFKFIFFVFFGHKLWPLHARIFTFRRVVTSHLIVAELRMHQPWYVPTRRKKQLGFGKLRKWQQTMAFRYRPERMKRGRKSQ